MNKEELMRKIQNLSFVKTEAELFLDTHPDCRSALDFYYKTVEELDAAMTEYQNKYGPLTADAVMGDKWTWIDGPWPWHVGNEVNGKMNNNAREVK